MGLEIVELFMRLEEEFEIDIPSEDAIQLETVGDIADYIAAKQQIPPEKRDELWEKLKAIVVDEVSVSPDIVRPQARLVQDLGLD